MLGLCIVQDNPIDNIRKPLYQWEYIILNFLPDKLYLLNFDQAPGHWYDDPFPVKNSINLIRRSYGALSFNDNKWILSMR